MSLLALTCGLSTAASTTGAHEVTIPSCARIEFVHVGPSDAAFEKVTLLEGHPSSSRQGVAHVPLASYRAISRLLLKPDESPIFPAPVGTYEATIFACNIREQTRQVDAHDFVSLVRQIRAAFGKEPMPITWASAETLAIEASKKR